MELIFTQFTSTAISQYETCFHVVTNLSSCILKYTTERLSIQLIKSMCWLGVNANEDEGISCQLHFDNNW